MVFFYFLLAIGLIWVAISPFWLIGLFRSELNRLIDAESRNKRDILKAISELKDQLSKRSIEPAGTEPITPLTERPTAIQPERRPAIPKEVAPIQVKTSIETPNVSVPQSSINETNDLAREAEPAITISGNIASPPSKAIDQKTAPAIKEATVAKKKFPVEPNYEKWIGENLSKVGIVILVLGVGFFVKYAIDRDWINQVGRTAIGLLVGLALLTLGHRLSKQYRSFSSVLSAGGISVLYLTIGIAFHLYSLINQPQAFGAMVGITILTVWLSVLYNRREFGIIAMLGGFGTPFFISTGPGDYRILFGYLVILNSGILLLALQKRWGELNSMAFGFTNLVYLIWLATSEISGNRIGALGFGVAFFGLFLCSNIAYGLKHRIPLKPREFILIVLNTLAIVGISLFLLNNNHYSTYKPYFILSLGGLHLLLIYVLRKRSLVDVNLIELLRGLSFCLIGLAVPLFSNGPAMPLAWSGMSIVMLRLSSRKSSELYIVFFQIFWALSILGLLSIWNQSYLFANVDRPISPPWLTGTFVSGALMMLTQQWLRKEVTKHISEDWSGYVIEKNNWLVIQSVLVPLIGYLVVWFELNHFVIGVGLGYSVQVLLLLMYHSLALNILFWTHAKAIRRKDITIPAIGVIALLIVVLLSTREPLNELRRSWIDTFPDGGWFWLHLIIFPLVIAALSYVFSESLRKNIEHKSIQTWAYVASLVLVSTIWLHHLGLTFSQSTSDEGAIEQVVARAGYSILWGLSAFVLIVVGLLRPMRELRMIGLCLLGLTVLKLFVFDISDASEAGRIVAFVTLGLVLLVISFMYQRLKKLMFSEDKPEGKE